MFLDCAHPRTGALFYSPLFPQHLAGAPAEKALPEHGTDPSLVDATRVAWVLVQSEMRHKLRGAGCLSPGPPQKIETTSSVHSKGNLKQRISFTDGGVPKVPKKRKEKPEISNRCDHDHS